MAILDLIVPSDGWTTESPFVTFYRGSIDPNTGAKTIGQSFDWATEPFISGDTVRVWLELPSYGGGFQVHNSPCYSNIQGYDSTSFGMQTDTGRTVQSYNTFHAGNSLRLEGQWSGAVMTGSILEWNNLANTNTKGTFIKGAQTDLSNSGSSKTGSFILGEPARLTISEYDQIHSSRSGITGNWPSWVRIHKQQDYRGDPNGFGAPYTDLVTQFTCTPVPPIKFSPNFVPVVENGHIRMEFTIPIGTTPELWYKILVDPTEEVLGNVTQAPIDADVYTYFVSGGQEVSPFYEFEWSQPPGDNLTNKNPVSFDRTSLLPGATYRFIDDGVNDQFPFMIGEHAGDSSSSYVQGGALGDPSSGGILTVTVPTDPNTELWYYNMQQPSMAKRFKLLGTSKVNEAIDVKAGSSNVNILMQGSFMVWQRLQGYNYLGLDLVNLQSPGQPLANGSLREVKIEADSGASEPLTVEYDGSTLNFAGEWYEQLSPYATTFVGDIVSVANPNQNIGHTAQGQDRYYILKWPKGKQVTVTVRYNNFFEAQTSAPTPVLKSFFTDVFEHDNVQNPNDWQRLDNRTWQWSTSGYTNTTYRLEPTIAAVGRMLAWPTWGSSASWWEPGMSYVTEHSFHYYRGYTSGAKRMAGSRHEGDAMTLNSRLGTIYGGNDGSRVSQDPEGNTIPFQVGERVEIYNTDYSSLRGDNYKIAYITPKTNDLTGLDLTTLWLQGFDSTTNNPFVPPW